MSQNASDIRRAHGPALADYFGTDESSLSDAQVLLWASRQMRLPLSGDPAPQLHIDRDSAGTHRLRG